MREREEIAFIQFFIRLIFFINKYVYFPLSLSKTDQVESASGQLSPAHSYRLFHDNCSL